MKGLALHIIEETMKAEDEMLQEIFDNLILQISTQQKMNAYLKIVNR